jgi:hypothetical protein
MSNETKLDRVLTKQEETDAMFDYVEAPIKEWLALVFDTPVMELFSDYKSYRKSLGIKTNNASYLLYFSSVDYENRYLFTTLDTKDESVRKAIDVLFNALYPVYTAVVNSSTLQEKLLGVYPFFDEINMTFSLRAVNQYRVMASQCQNALVQCHSKLSTAPIGTEYYEQLIEAQKKVIEGLNLCTEEVIKKRDEELLEINNKYLNMSKLYLVVVKNCTDDNEIGRRLPTFGLEFQDPDEDTYIDLLKKEQDINE